MKTQSNVSVDGSKIANPKISKMAHSSNIRAKRTASVVMQDCNKKYCPDCGFRIRGKNHADGTHHKGLSVPCQR